MENFKKPFVLLLTTFFLDRLSKLFALVFLSDGHTQNVFDGLDFSLSWNTGVSWSLLTPSTPTSFWILAGVIFCFITGIAVYTFWRWINRMPIHWEILILSGAISNFIDRVWYGAVVDFIDISYASYHFPVFNVADMCIFFGVVGIFFSSWRSER